MFRTSWYLAVIALVVTSKLSFPQGTPVAVHVDGVEVRLETEGGRTQFRLDELIKLELVFIGHTSGLTVNTMDYSDMSEQVNVSPAEGWFRHRERSRHDYLSTTPLGEQAIRIPVLLNQGIVFLKPGHYEVSVTTDRLMATPGSFAGTGVTTNRVGIDVTAPDEQEEAALVRSLSSQVATGSKQARQEAAMQLAFLGGDDAIRAKVHWLLDSGDPGQDIQRKMLDGLASSRNLKLQLDLLQAAWRDVQNVPDSYLLNAMQQTRAFLRKETLDFWSMVVAPPKPETAKPAEEERQRDLSEIVASLPQRTGKNRMDTAYFLMFNPLDAREMALARSAALAGFSEMEPMGQMMLLETRWKDIRDPSLLPALEAMLKAPNNLSSHRDALQRLIELSPETGKLYAVREICDPASDVMLEQMKELPEDTLPEVDGCLGKQLRGSTSKTNRQWQWKAMIAARFGSKKMLPAMQEIYAARKDWNVQADEGAFLAYFLRYAPQEGLARTAGLGANAQHVFFYVDQVFAARKAAFPRELQAWLREKVNNGQIREARWAAFELSRFGRAEDKVLLEQKLEQVRQQWRDRSTELEAAPNSSPEAEVRWLESDLVSTLVNKTEGKLWTLTPEEKAHLGEGCMTSECKRYFPETLQHRGKEDAGVR